MVGDYAVAAGVQDLSLGRTVTLLTAVPRQLARDSAFMTTNDHGDLSLLMACFQQYVNLVSCVLGKLRVAHGVLL